MFDWPMSSPQTTRMLGLSCADVGVAKATPASTVRTRPARKILFGTAFFISFSLSSITVFGFCILFPDSVAGIIENDTHSLKFMNEQQTLSPVARAIADDLARSLRQELHVEAGEDLELGLADAFVQDRKLGLDEHVEYGVAGLDHLAEADSYRHVVGAVFDVKNP
jgi:hypothetical protein